MPLASEEGCPPTRGCPCPRCRRKRKDGKLVPGPDRVTPFLGGLVEMVRAARLRLPCHQAAAPLACASLGQGGGQACSAALLGWQETKGRCQAVRHPLPTGSPPDAGDGPLPLLGASEGCSQHHQPGLLLQLAVWQDDRDRHGRRCAHTWRVWQQSSGSWVDAVGGIGWCTYVHAPTCRAKML